MRNIARSGIARASARSALLAIGLLLLGAGPALAVTGAPTGLTAATPTKAKPALTWVAPSAAGAVTPMHHRDGGGKSGKKQGFFECRITATNDKNVFATKKKPVTRSAGRNAVAQQSFLGF